MTLYNTDYVLVDIETQKPVESYDVINHFSSVINEYNDHLLSENIEYIPRNCQELLHRQCRAGILCAKRHLELIIEVLQA